MRGSVQQERGRGEKRREPLTALLCLQECGFAAAHQINAGINTTAGPLQVIVGCAFLGIVNKQLRADSALTTLLPTFY